MQAELVERARNGDHEAFALLVRSSSPRLYGAARLIMRDPDRAQDAVQEALVLAWRNLRALRDADAWDPWLYRLTVRACYRMARSARRRDLVEVAPKETGEEPGAPSVPDLSGDLAERDRLGRAIGRLPVDQRAVMVLHFYLDLPLPDAAAVLEIPIGTAKSRLHRGLQALRAQVDAEPEGAAVVAVGGTAR